MRLRLVGKFHSIKRAAFLLQGISILHSTFFQSKAVYYCKSLTQLSTSPSLLHLVLALDYPNLNL